MGAKLDKSKVDGSRTSLNPNERRRLTIFLESRGSDNHFNRERMNSLWSDLLVPDLLHSYSEFLMLQDTSNKNYIGLDEFAYIYKALVRGDAEEKVAVLLEIIGYEKGPTGKMISFTSLCKYLSDLLESYLLGLKSKNDANYISWTHIKGPERRVIEQVAQGIFSDLPYKNNEVQANELERWVAYTGLFAVLHSHVLGSLYNLDPEIQSNVVPEAVLLTTKTPTVLDISQVIYINSLLPASYQVTWRFVYSTTTHGESFSKLVSCMTDEGPVVVIIEANDNTMFGGFASENLEPGPRWVGTEDCFLFKLAPFVDTFPSTGYNDHFVYLNVHQSSMPNGFGMGGQFSYWGLWIDSHFGNGECSESCTTYKNYKMLATKKKFHIDKIEIWAVGERPLTAEERGERVTGAGTSVLDKDASAARLLEMAGHKTYSKGIREKH